MLLEENIADSISISSNSGHSQPISEYNDVEYDTEHGITRGGGIGGDGICAGGIGGGGLGYNICRNAAYVSPISDSCC